MTVRAPGKCTMLMNDIFHCLIVLVLAALVSGCETPEGQEDESGASDELQQIVDQAIASAGGEVIPHSYVTFDFRNRHYTAARDGGTFTYERIFRDSLKREVRDELSNDGLTRFIDGQLIPLASRDSAAYSNSVNSVIYFALLPYFLNDESVVKQYLGTESAQGKNYHKVKVTFQQEGGGKDFEDEFVYWFDTDTYMMDYLAYNYLTDGGGARLRKAYNVRTINGIRFADYENYKPDEKTREIEGFLEKLQKGEMELLSRIESENITVSTDF